MWWHSVTDRLRVYMWWHSITDRWRVCMEHGWDDDDRVEPSTVLGDNPVTVFLCLSQSPCGLAWDQTPGLHGERLGLAA
jgi:hypothetical protein